VNRAIEEPPELHARSIANSGWGRIRPVTAVPPARLPWLLVTASILFAVLFAYTLFGGYLPAKRRAASLERELRALYLREAELQTKVAQTERRLADVERQLAIRQRR